MYYPRLCSVRRILVTTLVLFSLSFLCCAPSQPVDEPGQEATQEEPSIPKEATSEVTPEATTEPVGSEPVADRAEPVTPQPEQSNEPLPTEARDEVGPQEETLEPNDDGGEDTPETSPDATPEVSPETVTDGGNSCPPGYRLFSIPGSYDIGNKLNVKRCVRESSGSGCTAVHQGDPSSIRFVFVGCGFNPKTERDRYNFLVQRIVEGYLKTEPYKSLKQRFSIIRNDNLQMGFDLTHKTSYCYEAWINATGEGAQAKPNWAAKTGLWYNPKWRPQLDACQGNQLVVLANNSGWAGGSHANWTGWFSIVGSGNDDRTLRRKRQGNQQVCQQWLQAHPGQCLWDGGTCFCDDTLPETSTGLPDNKKVHPQCSQQTPQHCPWPFTHPDSFIEYTAIHEVGHTVAGFAHPSTGTQAKPVTSGQEPNNCYLPPQGANIAPQQPCPGWRTADFQKWVLPQDSQGNSPKTFGCYKGCADNLNLYAPWTGTQMMIRDDNLDYGFSPVERKILADRLNEPCWVIGQKNPANPSQACKPGPQYNVRYGTGLLYQ